MNSVCNTDPLLEVSHINVCYGKVHILQDFSLHVSQGEIVAIVGPNGSGKTTLLRTIQGLMHPVDGMIRLAGKRVDTLPPYRLVKKGVALIPEARYLFLGMTVRENLELGAHTRRAQQEVSPLLQDVYDLFPILWEKRNKPAASLSAGQQQMLVIGRGLMAQPRLLLLDDPFLGLARGVTERFCETLANINHGGVTVLVAGQNVRRLLRLAQRAYLIERGQVVLEDKGRDLLDDPYLQEVLLTGRRRA